MGAAGMLIALAVAALGGLVSLLTAGSRQHKEVVAMNTIHRCSWCGQVVARDVAACRHCGRSLTVRS